MPKIRPYTGEPVGPPSGAPTGSTPAAIRRFDGPYSFLSSFHRARVAYAGLWYPTNEHGFQAAKTLDPAEREQIRAAETPGWAKRLGRRATLRPDWEQVKDEVMLILCRRKFAIRELAAMLRATGDMRLFEGNTWHDLYWGVDLVTGRGENRLGLILERVRNELRSGDLLPLALADYPGVEV